LKVNDPLRQQANIILKQFDNKINIGAIKNRVKLITKLKDNQTVIDNEINKNTKTLERLPPKTSGNIISLPKSDAVSSYSSSKINI